MALPRPLRIGTRGSPLALIQAREVAGRLVKAHGATLAEPEVVVIKTSGDRIQDRPLSEVGGKGLFTKEIEEALLKGDIDLAVHSMKDVATVLPVGLVIDCLLPREDVREAFISTRAASLQALPAGAVVGTSSLRRAAQVLRLRPDLRVVSFRGNVETRLRKLAEGQADATLLALAGLNRLGQAGKATALIGPDVMLPAVAQGAIGIERRAADGEVARLLAPLHHAETGLAVSAERAFLAVLDGSCRTPIAAHARIDGGRLVLAGQILSVDGRHSHEARREGPADAAERLGREVGEAVLAAAGPGFLARS